MFRPMRRHAQQLSQDDCERILTEQKRAVLSVIGDDGYPYGVPVNFVYVEGRVYIHSARAGHKLDAVAACDKASLCVMGDDVLEPGSWWHHVNSVIAFGRVRRIDDLAEATPYLRALAQKYFPPEVDIDADIAKNGSRVCMLELTPEHVSGKHVREK